MTGPRPPYGGNPDDPTQMGRTHNLGDRTQNLGDQTMRADASDFATQQAPDYAWSHEDPAAGQPAPYMGEQPPPYGADPYQQQYQQPQQVYVAAPVHTIELRS